MGDEVGPIPARRTIKYSRWSRINRYGCSNIFIASRYKDKYNNHSLYLILSSKFGPLAQLVEQLTLNQRVEGSTPSRLTIIKLREQ
jgi:hypothetical protein